MDDLTVTAGVARSVITPPVGVPMTGFAGRGSSEGVHDELTATALVITSEDGGGVGRSEGEPAVPGLVLVCCDLLYLSQEVIDLCRRAITEATGIAADKVLIACSHTHYGPATDGEGPSEVCPASAQVGPYVQNLTNLLAGTVLAASRRQVAAGLSVGTGTVSVGINRRERAASGDIILGQNPDGPCDATVRVLRVDAADGQPLAAVINYACHPVSLGSACTQISADYPAVARRVVEEATGARCLFMQGAAGNINPLLMGWSWNHLDRTGLPLGAECVRAYYDAVPAWEGRSRLARQRKVLDLPPLLPASQEQALAELAALEKQEQGPDASSNVVQGFWRRRRAERLRAGLAVLTGDKPPEPVRAEVSAVALGADLGVVTAPGEIFIEIGSSILADSPFAHTLFSGYTNGSIHYVPTRAAYAEGGYEVTRACIVAPDAGEILAKESISLLNSTHAAATRAEPVPEGL